MRSTTLGSRVIRPGLAGALIVAAATTFLGATGAGADDPELIAFQATAAADGIRVEVNLPGTPLTSNVFDGGAPVTQATVDGLGKSAAVASMPYPGENAVTLPGVVFPLVGLPPPPPYPLLALSQDPTAPESEVSAGGVELHAESDSSSSSARGQAGGNAGGTRFGNILATAAATADRSTAVVSAEAESAAESVTIEGVLSIGSARGTAKVTRPPDGEATSESGFAVDGVRVAGLTISVTTKGIVLPGTTVPIPDTSGLNPILDAAQITMRLLPAESFEGGVMSAGLAITIPAPATLGQGTVTFTIGRAVVTTASSVSDAAEPLPADLDVGSAPVAGPPGAPGPVPRVSDTRLPASASPSAPAVSSPPGPAGGEPELPIVMVKSASFYLMLIVGAVVAIVTSSLLRLFGVRLAWIH